MPNWYKAASGIQCAVFRPKVTLTKGDYEELKKCAKHEGSTVSDYLRMCAEDGVYSGMERTKEDMRYNYTIELEDEDA